MNIGAVTLRKIDTKYYNTVMRLDHILYNQSVLRQPHFDNSFKMEEIIYERKNIVNYRKKQQN